ncbi:MAG: phosphotransferase [Anaerolineales bacterium]|nr:phosphotransferase [Anaerolineales bacterium]
MSNQPDWTAVTQRAEAILGQPITEIEQFSDDGRRNLLLRCTLGQPPYSVVIKQTLPIDDQSDEMLAQDQLRFWQDWAGAALLTAVSDTHISPKFYGGDTALSFIILEDLGTGSSLVEPLLEGDAQSAEAALRQMMTRLGQMHAAAIDQAQTYEDILHTLDDQAAERVQQSLPDFAELPAKFADLGVAVAGFEQELAQVRTAVSNPGPFTTYVHLDPCPDNLFMHNGRLKIIDFEQGNFGHALRDALYLRMSFPTCWCANRVPTAVIEACEAVYRQQLGAKLPIINDDALFTEQCLLICAFWVWNRFDRLLAYTHEPAVDWGIASVRSRLLTYLHTFIQLTDSSDKLPAMRETAVQLQTTLQAKWPETELLPYYPAFRA